MSKKLLIINTLWEEQHFCHWQRFWFWFAFLVCPLALFSHCSKEYSICSADLAETTMEEDMKAQLHTPQAHQAQATVSHRVVRTITSLTVHRSILKHHSHQSSKLQLQLQLWFDQVLKYSFSSLKWLSSNLKSLDSLQSLRETKLYKLKFLPIKLLLEGTISISQNHSLVHLREFTLLRFTIHFYHKFLSQCLKLVSLSQAATQ